MYNVKVFLDRLNFYGKAFFSSICPSLCLYEDEKALLNSQFWPEGKNAKHESKNDWDDVFSYNTDNIEIIHWKREGTNFVAPFYFRNDFSYRWIIERAILKNLQYVEIYLSHPVTPKPKFLAISFFSDRKICPFCGFWSTFWVKTSLLNKPTFLYNAR